MPIEIIYTGTQQRWPELATTGKQSVWMPGQIEERDDVEAGKLLATGLFKTEPVALTVTTSAQGIKIGASPKKNIVVANDGSGDFLTLGAAVKYLSGCDVIGTDIINVTLEDGHYYESESVFISSPSFFWVWVKGRNSYAKSISGVVSSSGSAGAWSYVLAVDSAENIAVDDWVIINGLSGGTNPTYLGGVLRITAVDAGANQITVESKHVASSAASGAVVGTATVLKSIIHAGAGKRGTQIWNGCVLGQMAKLMWVGNGGSSGIDVQDNGRLLVTGPVGVARFATNWLATEAGEITSAGVMASSDATIANFSSVGGGASITLMAGSVSSGAGSYGMLGQAGGTIWAGLSCLVTGCTYGAYAIDAGAVCITSGSNIISGCGTGVYSRTYGYVPAGAASPQLVTNTLNEDRSVELGGVKIRSSYPVATADGGVFSYESGGNMRYYMGPNAGYSLTLSARSGGATTDHFRFIDNGHYQERSKEVVATAGLTAYTIAKKNTYFSGAAGASFAITLPAVGAAIDGQKMTVMSVVDRPSTTWVGTGGATVNGPSALSAKVPVTLQYDQASVAWYPTT